jgi:hypothetical protein
LLALAATGCVSEVTMSDTRAPEQADCTIQYSAVRAGSRLFGDYSVVDQRILAGDPAAAPSEKP